MGLEVGRDGVHGGGVDVDERGGRGGFSLFELRLYRGARLVGGSLVVV